MDEISEDIRDAAAKAYDKGWTDALEEPRPFAAARESLKRRYLEKLGALSDPHTQSKELPNEVARFLADRFRQAYSDYVRTIIENGESLPYSQHIKATEAAIRAVIALREGD